MKEILLARVDDRLMHGQITLKWIPYTGADTVVIIDNELSKNEFMKNIINSACPKNLSIHILSSGETVEYIKKIASQQKIILLSKDIYNYEKIMKENIYIEKINIGSSGYKNGKKLVNESIYLSEKDLESAGRILESGTKIEIQMLPESKIIKMEDIIRKIK